MALRYFLLILAAASSAIAIIFPLVWWLAPFGLALFFYVLLTHATSGSSAGWYGLVFGLITGGAGILWFWSTYPLTFLGITNPVIQIAAIGLTWLYVSLSLAVAIGVFAVVVWRLRLHPLLPLVIPLLWVLAEEGRMWGFAVFTYASESLVGPHFSAASLGYVLTEHPYLLQLAYPFGIAALNGVVALMAIVALQLAQARAGRLKAMTAALVILLVGIGTLPLFISYRDTGEPMTTKRVAVLASDAPAGNRPAAYQHARALLQEATTDQGVELIVVPEAFGLTQMFGNQETGIMTIRSWMNNRDVLIATSERVPAPEGEGASEQLVYTSTTHGPIGSYTKMMLMPLGEYLPAFSSFLYALITDATVASHFNLLRTTQLTGGSDVAPVAYNHMRIGGLLCSDILSPVLYDRLATTYGANLLLSVSNHYWFHGSPILFDKTLQMARVHAVQHHLPLVVANNETPSFILGPSGEELIRSRWNTPEVLIYEVPIALPE